VADGAAVRARRAAGAGPHDAAAGLGRRDCRRRAAAERGSPADQVDDEILPLGDMSILITRENAIDRLRPDGSIERFAGTGRYSESSSGDGGPAPAARLASPQDCFPHATAAS
jgi:hypothetical protein